MDKKNIFSKRRLIQVCSAFLYNINLSGFFTASIYKGAAKGICVPGLNCYSCPGAVGACPLGSLQNALSSGKLRYIAYIVGTFLIFGALLGRVVCGFLCPFGLIQELLYMIPTKKIKKSKLTKALSKLKYVFLAVFVVGLPLLYFYPAFCRYICPAGTLEAGIPLVLGNENLASLTGNLYILKITILIAIAALSIFVFRVFCRFICPLGALYGFFNTTSVLGIKVDKHKCTNCKACVRVCKMDVSLAGDMECIQCGECIEKCPEGAIIYKKRREK